MNRLSRKPRLDLLCIGLLAVGVWTVPDGAVRGEPLTAGTATVDITPPVPFRMCGSFSERLSTGIKDPLKAKAVVLAQGGRKAALVFCDLAHVSLDVSTRTRTRVSAEVGIPAAHIAIAATHSHTGPLYWGVLRNHFHEQAVRQYGRDPHEQIDYAGRLVDRLVDVITRADAAATPVRLAAGRAIEDRLSFNRRFHMKTGPVRFNPGQLNPDIVRPAGPIDPEVGLIALQAAGEDRYLGAIVSFALHLDTVGGTRYSGDFPFVVQQELRKSYGPDFVSLFGAGTCGDINHIDVTVRGRRSTEQIGTMLAATIADKLPDLKPLKNVSLAVRREIVHAPLQQVSPAEVAAAREKMRAARLPFLERVATYKTLAVAHREGETLPLEVQVFRLNADTAIVTLPGEVFVELGIAIKTASPFETTLVIELTNDGPGYIPTRKAFAEGSYETVNSRVQPGGGEQMVAAAVRLLRELAE